MFLWGGKARWWPGRLEGGGKDVSGAFQWNSRGEKHRLVVTVFGVCCVEALVVILAFIILYSIVTAVLGYHSSVAIYLERRETKSVLVT